MICKIMEKIAGLGNGHLIETHLRKELLPRKGNTSENVQGFWEVLDINCLLEKIAFLLSTEKNSKSKAETHLRGEIYTSECLSVFDFPDSYCLLDLGQQIVP